MRPLYRLSLITDPQGENNPWAFDKFWGSVKKFVGGVCEGFGETLNLALRSLDARLEKPIFENQKIQAEARKVEKDIQQQDISVLREEMKTINTQNRQMFDSQSPDSFSENTRLKLANEVLQTMLKAKINTPGLEIKLEAYDFQIFIPSQSTSKTQVRKKLKIGIK